MLSLRIDTVQHTSMYTQSSSYLKVHFVIHILTPPPIFHQKCGDFYICRSLQIHCMCAKYFLQIHLFEEVIAALAIYYVDMKNIIISGLCMQQVQYNKTCITLKSCNLRIDWKFGYRPILSISTEQCNKNSISKSQNGPLNITESST